MPATTNPTPNTQPEQDFVAALYEIKSNLDVRRLMFILINVLVPMCAIAITDCLSGSAYPPSLRWLPEHIFPIVGGIMTVSGVLVTGILTRCHFGLVVNGSKMRKVMTGRFHAAPLNWLGVTTNFVALTALYAGAGFSLLLVAVELSWLAGLGGVTLFALLMLYLQWNHGRANRLCTRLLDSWQQGEVTTGYREEHVRESLDATTADISVIVTMAVALFSGTFNSMTSIGGIGVDFLLRPSVDVIQSWGVPVLSGFTLVSLLLSGRMVVRLRIALAEHSQTLAALRLEQDDPWRFKLQERTYLLFALLNLLTSASALILVWSFGGQWLGISAGVALLVIGLLWYPLRLGYAYKRAMATS